MAILLEKKVREEIQKKHFRSIYYCYGEEHFKVEHFLESLQRALGIGAEQAFQVELYYGDELQAKNLLESVDSVSLWQARKLLVIKSADRIPAKQQELLRDLILRGTGGNILVFLAQKADARTKWIQQISKDSEQAVLVHFEAAPEWEFLQWARQFAKAEGKELDTGAEALLVDWLQGSLSELQHTVQKAALFSAGRDIITAESVRAVSVRLRPENAFEFTGALLQQNRILALTKLHKLLEQGEEPLALLGLLVRQYRWLLAILALRAEGKDEPQIQSELRLFPRVAKDLFAAARRLGSKGVLLGLKHLTEADLQLKSTREPQELVLTRLFLALVE